MNPVPPRDARKSTSARPLRHGERLTQAEFHRRYEASPPDFKAELIGGVVHLPSPLRRRHGAHHVKLSGILDDYQAATPGVEALDNTTTILSETSEPQPDLALWIVPESGAGQARESEDGYVEGAPELVAEVAESSRVVDLGRKREDYEQFGVVEYLVLCLAPLELHWFDFRADREILPNRQGIAKSRVFPGLWIDVPGLLARDSGRLTTAIQRGLASRQHAAFVKRLARARSKRP